MCEYYVMYEEGSIFSNTNYDYCEIINRHIPKILILESVPKSLIIFYFIFRVCNIKI